MKMLKVAAMLIACGEGTQLNAESHKHQDIDEKEVKLSQSIA